MPDEWDATPSGANVVWEVAEIASLPRGQHCHDYTPGCRARRRRRRLLHLADGCRKNEKPDDHKRHQ